MGRQLAFTFAERGVVVSLYDRNSSTAEAAAEWARQRIGSTRGALIVSRSLAEAVLGADLILETVNEDPDLKRAIFAEVSQLNEEALLASNSSAMPSSRWADTTRNPQRLLNAHFYVRPWERRVVELMSSGPTSSEAMSSAETIFTGLGFHAFRLRAESTGLLYNRIWAAIKRECLSMVDEDIAGPAEIDDIYRLLDPQPSRGPFERMDMVGLDTVRDIEAIYAAEAGTDVSPTLTGLVRDGHLGVKTGRGFYTYAHSPELRVPD